MVSRFYASDEDELIEVVKADEEKNTNIQEKELERKRTLKLTKNKNKNNRKKAIELVEETSATEDEKQNSSTNLVDQNENFNEFSQDGLTDENQEEGIDDGPLSLEDFNEEEEEPDFVSVDAIIDSNLTEANEITESNGYLTPPQNDGDTFNPISSSSSLLTDMPIIFEAIRIQEKLESRVESLNENNDFLITKTTEEENVKNKIMEVERELQKLKSELFAKSNEVKKLSKKREIIQQSYAAEQAVYNNIKQSIQSEEIRKLLEQQEKIQTQSPRLSVSSSGQSVSTPIFSSLRDSTGGILSPSLRSPNPLYPNLISAPPSPNPVIPKTPNIPPHIPTTPLANSDNNNGTNGLYMSHTFPFTSHSPPITTPQPLKRTIPTSSNSIFPLVSKPVISFRNSADVSIKSTLNRK